MCDDKTRIKENVMNIKTVLALVISCIAYFTLISPSYSADSKIHPGSMCKAYFGSDESSLRKGLGSVKNTTTSAVWVTCPIVRDNTTNTNGLSQAYIRIGRSSTATADFWCTLDSRNTVGTQSFFATNSYSGTSTTSMSFNLSGSTNRGHYEILCRLPRDSNIFSYRIDEF